MCQTVSELINGRILCQVVSGSFLPSNSAHEPHNAVVDYQALTHFEVHGRNARKEVSGKSHYDQSPGKTGGFRAQALGWLWGGFGVALG